MNRQGRNKPGAVTALVFIVIAGFAVYLNSLGGEFLWDDIHFIKNNVYLRSWSHLPEIFTRDVAAGSGERYNYYRPLTIFTYLIDHTLWGLDARSYHLANILYHVLTALSVYLLVEILFRDRLLSFLTGLLYVIHPINTETVAYISGRPDSLCAFFMLACFILYIKYLDHEGATTFILMIASCICAVLSRENCIVLPALLLLYHLTFKRKLRIKPFLPIAAIAGAYILLRMYFMDPAAAPTTLSQRAPGFFAAIAGYCRLILLPFDLHQEYGPQLFHFHDGRVIAGIVIVTFAFVTCLLLAVKQRAAPRGETTGTGGGTLVIFSILWFFISLLPVSGIYPIAAYMAEHWLYVPSIGLFILLSYGLCSLYRARGLRTVSVICMAGLAVFYGASTIRQNSYFKDPLTFFERTLKYSPGSARIHNNLGIKYFEAGRIDEGMARFKKAIEIDPRYPEAYNNLGHVYYTMGRNDEAQNLFVKATELNPRYAEAYCNLGVLYINTGKPEEGLALFRKATELNPYDADALFNLGLAYKRMGAKVEAIAAFEKVLVLDPSYARAHQNLALLRTPKPEYEKRKRE